TVMEPHMRQSGGLAQRAPRTPPRRHRPRRVQLPALPMPRKEEMVRVRKAELLRAVVQFAKHGETVSLRDGSRHPAGVFERRRERRRSSHETCFHWSPLISHARRPQKKSRVAATYA